MSKVNDGGPAFPVEMYDAKEDVDTVFPGMSLRDYFAAKVIAAITVNGSALSWEEDAMVAYQAADAMLKERAKG